MAQRLRFLPCVLLVFALAACAATGTAEIVAHRGASHDAPENTLAAFLLAWEQGADAIEGDFRLTGDGKIVCIHDETTERVADRTLTVAESSLEDLSKLDVGSWRDPRWKGERIPTLAEVLGIVPDGKRILIEIKCGPEILGPLKETLATSGLRPDQTVVIAFDADVIAQTKRELPRLKALWITDFEEDEETGTCKPSVGEILAELRRVGADGVDCRAHAVVDRDFAGKLRRARLELHVWTINEGSEAIRFQELGVDSVTTDRPALLKQKLRGR